MERKNLFLIESHEIYVSIHRRTLPFFFQCIQMKDFNKNPVGVHDRAILMSLCSGIIWETKSISSDKCFDEITNGLEG